MKNLLIIATLALFTTTATAQVRMPAPSPKQTIKQDFAMGSIEVVYSRPAMNERKVFGDLVPFDKVWRTGANGATLITFTEPVEINGKRIDTGKYALYTIPGVENWEIILNRGTKNWGNTGYNESDDVIRFKAAPYKLKNEAENFTIQFDNIKPETCELHLMWDKTGVSFPINANIKESLRKQVEAALLTDKKPYFEAARFYNEYDNNYAKALENISKAAEANPKAYYIYLYKARIQKAMGDINGARATSKQSLEIARAEKSDDYIKLNEDFLKGLR